MGLAEDILRVASKAYYNKSCRRTGFIGVVLRGMTKEDVQRGDYILVNADWRIKKAMELCGFDIANTTMIAGIEKFHWC